MLHFFPPTLRIALGMTCVVVSLCLTGASLGFIPQPHVSDLSERERVVRVLSQRLLPAVSTMDSSRAQDVLKDVREVNTDIASIGVRQLNGAIFAATPGHQHWLNLPGDVMPETQIFAEILYGAKSWGRVEVRFRELPQQVSLMGLPASLGLFFLYVGAASFTAFWFYLKRIVTELDPSQAVPERVQNAFDTMSEGVLILDTSGNILLANSALCEKLGRTPEELFGQKASQLSWIIPEDGSGLPWETCLETGQDVRSIPISLQVTSGGRSNFVVNVTAIKDQGSHRGVIATFDDITELHETNQRLNLANVELKKTQDEIKVQNEQLRVLASYDPLSGSLNRRAFFAEFDTTIRAAFDAGKEVACFMTDIDHFKRINDTFGHATGDKVIAGLADTLRTVLREGDVIGRFGGEEFCVVLPNTDLALAEELANRVRTTLTARSHEWFDVPYAVTASIGVAMMMAGKFEPNDVVNRSDEALYVAKTSGRNRVVCWQPKDGASADEGVKQEHGSSPQTRQHGDIDSPTEEAQSTIAEVSDHAGEVLPDGIEVEFNGTELTIVINDCVSALKEKAGKALDKPVEDPVSLDASDDAAEPYVSVRAS